LVALAFVLRHAVLNYPHYTALPCILGHVVKIPKVYAYGEKTLNDGLINHRPVLRLRD
jgi:hypothetical protein